jgi:glycerol dehydrogenase-like iron-containing ADH family enzyme
MLLCFGFAIAKFVQMCNCCGIISKSFPRSAAEHMFMNATRQSPERSMDFATFAECLLSIARQSYPKENGSRAIELLLSRNSLSANDGHLILASSPVERNGNNANK